MPVRWHETVTASDGLAVDAPIDDKATIICRAGLLLLSGGTGGWRVRDEMNRIARVLGVTVITDVSLMDIECTVVDGDQSFSEVVALPTSGVNTERIWLMEKFTHEVEAIGHELTVQEYHELMDDIEHRRPNYSPLQAGLASALACAAFVFLLGGGLLEMACAFVGAGVGNYVRRRMLDHGLNQFFSIGVSVGASCVCYLVSLMLISLGDPNAMTHEAGYIGAMLFVIPGFPLITSGLDIMQLDMRSGLERLAYAVSVIVVATLVGWMVASMVQLWPDDFVDLGLSPAVMCGLRLVASFCGVFGFSVMFNSTPRMAATAGVIGAVANTLRLELVSLGGMPPEAAAFLGALASGLLASAIGRRLGFPRISLTVPSIVIMVPGLYMYRAVYYMGSFAVADSMSWLMRAVMIVAFLPLGLALARALTDRRWRHCS
jgi:uncharacterized membrane protein YjjP (DUF1212 family)